MSEPIIKGIQWPEITNKKTKKLSRSSTGTATKILSAAYGAANKHAEASKLQNVGGGKWRFGYQKFFIQVTEMIANSNEKETLAIAEAVLNEAKNNFEFYRNGMGVNLNTIDSVATNDFSTGMITGMNNDQPRSSVEVPYNKQTYNAKDGSIQKLLDTFVQYGDMEQSASDAINSLLNSKNTKQYEDLSDLHICLIGATSEMGPMEFLLDHGATVIALARPGEKKWKKLIARAKRSRGRLIFPTIKNNGDEDSLAKAAGADALAQTPEIGNWLGSLFPGKKIFIYSLIYLDGEKYVRASMAMDVIVDMATSIRGADKVGLLYIATPSAAHVVDAKCERRAKLFYKNVPFWQKIFEMVGLLKRQKFLTLQSHTDHRVVDCLASMQGPNYALAKFLQTCRVLIARIKYGQFVSVNVAPPALTASVMHAPKIAAAAPYIPLFKPNVMYYPDTASSILSLLLLADIRNKKSNSYASTKLAHPLLLIADQAWHGGCFNAPYSSESTGVASYISYLLYKTMPWMVVILVAVMLYFTSGRFF